MNDLTDLVQLLIQALLGTVNAVLADVDSIGEQGTARVDALGVTALGELNSLILQESADMFVKFVFLNGLHRCL